MKERSNVRMKYLIMMTCTDSSTEPYSIQPPFKPQYRSEDPTRPREPDSHSQRTERDSERGEGDLVVRWTGEGNWWSGLVLEID